MKTINKQRWDQYDVAEQSRPQHRWNECGKRRLNAMRENPKKFIIDDSPYSREKMNHDLMQSLGPLEGKTVLELGCGLGSFAVFLAKQGARVTGVDIGPDLIESAKVLAEINHVDCEFHSADVVDLPFDTNSYQLVVGKAVLHHLSQSDLKGTVEETHRVLDESGVAIFYEPVENSRIFDFIQDLFPAGIRSSGNHRPSMLQGRAWAKYVETIDDRPLTTRELVSAGKPFRMVTIRPYGFLIRLKSLLGRRHQDTLMAIDNFLFKYFPAVKYLCRNVLVEYSK